jgi:hypothetical protein
MKTKTLASAMFFSSLAYSVSGQSFDKQEMQHSKWSISMALNSVEAQINQQLVDTWVLPTSSYYSFFGNKNDKSISLSIVPKYQITEDIGLCFEASVTAINLKSHYDGSKDYGYLSAAVADNITDVSIEQKIYRVVPKIQWDFIEKKFIDSYCGFSASFLSYSKVYWQQNSNRVSSPSEYTNYTGTTVGGFASGIGTFAGINVHLCKGVSIGSEFSYSLLYYKLGGFQNGRTEKRIYTGAVDVVEWSIANNASKGLQFSKVMPSFHISFQL